MKWFFFIMELFLTCWFILVLLLLALFWFREMFITYLLNAVFSFTSPTARGTWVFPLLFHIFLLNTCKSDGKKISSIRLQTWHDIFLLPPSSFFLLKYFNTTKNDFFFIFDSHSHTRIAFSAHQLAIYFYHFLYKKTHVLARSISLLLLLVAVVFEFTVLLCLLNNRSKLLLSAGLPPTVLLLDF